ncbi:MAG: UMP kinase [Bacteroidetes bacterium]|nr:UMP kinase [Bacteroidota bacterium]
MEVETKYKRVLLKLSGESLMGDHEYGIDPKVLRQYAEEIHSIHSLGVQIGIVIGGGNIYRGAENSGDGVDKVTGDHMGMLATVINALALQSTLEHHGMFTRCQTAIDMERIAEPYIRRRAVRHLEKGRIVIFAAGTGNPYFTTDTAGVLRAIEIGADVVIKGTRVNGIYDSDPETNSDAKFYSLISYDDVFKKNLKVMDMTAITLCKENKLPLAVININVKDNLKKLILGEQIGSLVNGNAPVIQ